MRVFEGGFEYLPVKAVSMRSGLNRG